MTSHSDGGEALGTPADTSYFMEGMLKKRGDVKKAWRQRWVRLCFDEELGYILEYGECVEMDNGDFGPGKEVKFLIVRGANLKVRPKGNVRDAIGKDKLKLCICMQEGPGGRTGDKVHYFLCETEEELKEWMHWLGKAAEKTINWSRKADAKQKAKNAFTSMTDNMMGVALKHTSVQMDRKTKNKERDVKKSIQNFFKGFGN